jgi:eukaryotic-like serine/threonine-protein kinase
VLQPNHIVAGRYRVVRHIASGGMGAVYEAEHLATEARVALKVLLPQMLQIAAARRRFELEARVAARVNSEHIVRVLDAGVDPETHSPYLAMELLAGETLAARIKHTGPLAATPAVEVLRQVARGLDAAHGYRAGDGTPQPIVHRDLKPENLFLTRRADGTTLVKILDFGIAKVLSASTAVSREVRGTPLYMAYEQLVGEAVSPQTDIWALGLVTHFVLTGRTYWSEANNAMVSAQALFAQILTLPLPRPSQRLMGDGPAFHVPAAFDTWLLTCIERDPSRRFPSASSAVAALERALASSEAVASPGAPPARRMLGGRFGSRVTARYDLGLAGSTSSGSVTSLPPVASERARERQRGSRRGWLELSGALTLVALAAGGVAWGVASFRARGAARDASVATRAPAADTNVPRAATVELRRADEIVPAQTPRGVVHVEPVAAPSADEAAPATPPPRVTVRALEPVAAPAKPPSPAPTPAPPAPSAPRVAPVPAGLVPVAGAPPPSNSPPSSEPPASKPASKTTGDAPCDHFDPYTGRCAVAAPARERAVQR